MYTHLTVLYTHHLFIVWHRRPTLPRCHGLPAMGRLVACNHNRVSVEQSQAHKLHGNVQHEHLLCFERKGVFAMTELFYSLVEITNRSC